MNDQLPEIDAIRSLDPARAPIDDARRRRHLLAVLRSIDSEGRRRPTRTPRALITRLGPPLALGAASLVAAALMLIGAPSTPPSPPGADRTSVQREPMLAAGATSADGTRILVEERIGEAQVLLGERDGVVRAGWLLPGHEPGRNWETIAVPKEPPRADGVEVLSSGTIGTGRTTEIAATIVRVGSDVTALTYTGARSRPVPAVVRSGYAIIAWKMSRSEIEAQELPGPDESHSGSVFTATTRDGRTTTIPFEAAR
jgi:hypothetical protein